MAEAVGRLEEPVRLKQNDADVSKNVPERDARKSSQIELAAEFQPTRALVMIAPEG